MTVEPRNLTFDFSSDTPKHWFGGLVFETHFLNALSSLLPEGERFIIRTVRQFSDQLSDPKLLKDVQGFISQEGSHSKQHDQHVDLLIEQGFTTLAPMNRFFRRVMSWYATRTPRYSLAVATCVEHLTATLAQTMTQAPATWFEPMSPEMRRFWEWHAIEELEHKAVTYDLYQGMNLDYPLRALATVQALVGLSSDLFVRHCYLLYKDEALFDLDEWRRGSKFLLGSDGILSRVFGEFRQFLRRDFHPDERDDSAVIRAYDATYKSALHQ